MHSKSQKISNLHHWFKSYGNFDEWPIDGKGLRLHPAQQACFFCDDAIFSFLFLHIHKVTKTCSFPLGGKTIYLFTFIFWKKLVELIGGRFVIYFSTPPSLLLKGVSVQRKVSDSPSKIQGR